MKRKTFIDYLQDLFSDIADAIAEPIILVFNFLDSLPGFNLVKEFEILPEGTLLKGFITREERSELEFEFKQGVRQEEVEVFIDNERLYAGPWAEATRVLVDTVSPGDRMMTINSPHSPWSLFSYNPKKKTN